MAEKQQYTATIKSKRCKGTGLTEEIIRECHTRPGRRIMIVAELRVDDAHNKIDAPDHVDFTIEQIEPAMEAFFDEHLRELIKTKFKNRVLNSDEEQLRIDTQDDLARPLEDVVAEGKAHGADDVHTTADEPVPV